MVCPLSGGSVRMRPVRGAPGPRNPLKIKLPVGALPPNVAALGTRAGSSIG